MLVNPRRAGLLFITRLVLTSFSAGAQSLATEPQTQDVFLWGGKQLSELKSDIAGKLRLKYGPIVEKYPTMDACRLPETGATQGGLLTRADLQALPSLEAAEVCLFY